MIAIVVALCLLEIWWDWRLIEKKHRSPNYRGSNRLRVAVGALVWLVYPVFVKMEHWQWLMAPVVMGVVYWFVFDYGLNVARGKPLMYLGEGSRLDRWQKKQGGEKVWFWIKFWLMITGAYVLSV